MATESAGERNALLNQIAAEYRETAQWTGKEEIGPRLRAALSKVPREAFVPEAAVDAAYANVPLAIGFGQTISQPYIVAIMTDLLELEPSFKVLEIGTGSGYQAAILGALADRVFSIETIPELADRAALRLRQMGYANVEVRTGDGSLGWPEAAPFDAIIVTAAAAIIPEPLVAQLKPGGRMVIPVGRPHDTQQLTLVTKDAAGRISEYPVLPVAFVPLVPSKP